MRSRLVAVCVVVAAALAGAGGCSSGGGGRADAVPSSPASASASAPSSNSPSPAPSSADPSSARLTALMRKLAGWSDGHSSVTGTETVDFDGRKLRYDGLFAWGPQPAMDVRAGTAQLGLERWNPAEKTEVRQAGGAYYYHVGPQPSGPLKGRHWLRSSQPLSAAGNAVAQSGLLVGPGDALRMLADGTGWADLGTETVDGTSGTHYRGTVTAAALASDAKLAPAAGGSPSPLLAGADTAELDVWVDAKGKPLRWVAMLAPGRSVAIDLGDFGGLHLVTRPSPTDTADASKLPG